MYFKEWYSHKVPHNMIAEDLGLIEYDISGPITLQRVISFSPITKKSTISGLLRLIREVKWHFWPFSVFSLDGNIRVTLTQKTAKLELPLRRSKGSQGNIPVRWSLDHNDSTDISDLIWPSSGTLSMTDGQWSGSLTVNVANNIKKLPGNVIWVKLVDTTGGALLASKNETTTKIVLVSPLREKRGQWFIITFFVSVGSVVTILLFSYTWTIMFRETRGASNLAQSLSGSQRAVCETAQTPVNPWTKQLDKNLSFLAL